MEEVLNPHIPKYIVKKPWYTTRTEKKDQLNHQRAKKKKRKIGLNQWYTRGKDSIIHQATKYRKGACKNCGSNDHKTKNCLERKRKRGAHLTNKNIAPDRKIENLKMNYSAKKDHWSSYDVDEYQHVIEKYKDLEVERRKVLSQKLDSEGLQKMRDEDMKNEEDETNEILKFQSGAHDGKTRTSSRNLRIRENVAKYLINIDEDSPFYDPKTRSMRGNPNMNNQSAFYKGDNAIKATGDVRKFRNINYFAWEARKRGKDIHVASDPSKTELSHKEYVKKKKALLENTQKGILNKYGIDEKETNRKKFFYPDEKKIVVKNQQPLSQRILYKQNRSVTSKYNEDVLNADHTEIFGSYWKDGRWGYLCCKQFEKHCNCTKSGKKRKGITPTGPTNQKRKFE